MSCTLTREPADKANHSTPFTPDQQFCTFTQDSSLFADLGNRILNIQNGNILLLLPVSILYETFILLWKLLVFNFAIMPEIFALE